MTEPTHHELRHTIQPYIGQTAILSGVTIFIGCVAYKSHVWQTFFAVLGGAILYTLYTLYLGLKYRILWDDSGVTMRASGGPACCFAYDEIKEIKYEVAATQSRPFRRIVLYKHHHPDDEFIDISLKHFPIDQINQLLSGIRTHRPDLSVPTISTNGTVTFPNEASITPYSYRGGSPS